jgi:hypothetical protein
VQTPTPSMLEQTAVLDCGRTKHRPQGTKLLTPCRGHVPSSERLRLVQLVSSWLSDATVRSRSQHFTGTSHTHVFIFHCSCTHQLSSSQLGTTHITGLIFSWGMGQPLASSVIYCHLTAAANEIKHIMTVRRLLLLSD